MDKLKPCPFCGKKAEMYEPYTGALGIRCTNISCNVFMPRRSWRMDGRKEDVMQALCDLWNRRAKNV